MSKHLDLAPLDPLPAHWTDAIQELLSGFACNLRLRIKPGAANTLQVPGGSDNAQVGLVLNGKWRYNAANVERAGSGSARTVDVHATASANVFVPGSPGEEDDTVHAFDLVITEVGVDPTGVAHFRKLGTAIWDGTQFTSATLEIAFTSDDPRLPTQGENDALAGTSGTPSSSNKYVTNADARNSDQRTPLDGSVTNAKVNAAAAIAMSKLALAITNAEVAGGAAIVYSKLALAASIVHGDIAAANKDGIAATPSMRTLGTGAQQATPGDHQALTGTAHILPIVTTLPTSGLVDGQEARLLTAAMASAGWAPWRLRYRAAISAWEPDGRPEIYDYYPTSDTSGSIAQLTWAQANATNDPTITVPVTATYKVTSTVQLSLGVAGPVYVGMKVDSTFPSTSPIASGVGSDKIDAASATASLHVEVPDVALTAGQVVKQCYAHNFAGTATLSRHSAFLGLVPQSIPA